MALGTKMAKNIALSAQDILHVSFDVPLAFAALCSPVACEPAKRAVGVSAAVGALSLLLLSLWWLVSLLLLVSLRGVVVQVCVAWWRWRISSFVLWYKLSFIAHLQFL